MKRYITSRWTVTAISIIGVTALYAAIDVWRSEILQAVGLFIALSIIIVFAVIVGLAFQRAKVCSYCSHPLHRATRCSEKYCHCEHQYAY